MTSSGKQKVGSSINVFGISVSEFFCNLQGILIKCILFARDEGASLVK